MQVSSFGNVGCGELNDNYTIATAVVGIYHNKELYRCHHEAKPDCKAKPGVLQDHQAGVVLNFQRYFKIELFVGLRWLVASNLVKERNDFIPSLEVCGTHDAFPQSIVEVHTLYFVVYN